ncbi:hypothetical protein WA1_11825 [Scytonema hofmannii PCC 7110]|uniref:Peptidase A2 domain-containing protein n=1 Tax=Scytonema hofmannii PCC 7110 TaxID=128403 RepID=A0A139XDN4_9CYAN|nr:hypothetical protein [Scytonema hofmannii]KYC42810.1 hypothetical protein WA1_11825 [Scytonema hofmannii PCC 7110]
MLEGKRFPFVESINNQGITINMPYLPLTLNYPIGKASRLENRSIEVMGLLDTGATVNVLPYNIGLQLGAVWEQQTTSVQLSGNLAGLEARGLILSAVVANYSPVLLAFAWTESRDAPLILGHMNFFSEFDTCFYRSDLAFEIRPKKREIESST